MSTAYLPSDYPQDHPLIVAARGRLYEVAPHSNTWCNWWARFRRSAFVRPTVTRWDATWRGRKVNIARRAAAGRAA